MHARQFIMAVLLAGLTFWVASPAPAQQQLASGASAAGRTPMPAIPRGTGDKCVEPTDWMRRNHMTALTHKRDATMYEGERSAKFSLKACISCHAVQGGDGRPVTVADPRHFCRSCHDYAAVQVDCFECHASRPEPGKAAGLQHPAQASSSETAALARYLEASR